jgi:hypothetical protein
MISYILYTHSEYNDCWAPTFDRLNRHCGFKFDKYFIFSDSVDDHIDSKFSHISYDDTAPYTNRLLSCLSQIDTEMCLFTHEDMMLYGDVHEQYFEECVSAVRDSNVDFVKLLKGGMPQDTDEDIKYKGSDILNYIDTSFHYIFAIQPTIWKTQSLISLLESSQEMSIWDFEVRGQFYCREKRYVGLYANHKEDKKRGEFHWDSITYPYISTAIYKGKWVTSQYPDELSNLFFEYNINPLLRGAI